MIQNVEWFSKPKEPTAPEPSTEQRILEYMRTVPLGYSREIADELDLDQRTVSKWLNRLLRAGQIASVDMRIQPTPEQAERIKEHRVNGMKPNHFKNAKWYFIPQGDGIND